MAIRNHNHTLRSVDFGVDSVQRLAMQTGLPPFILILALRLRHLGLRPEQSILWSRAVFEKHPSEAILAAYEEVLSEYAEETNSVRVRELCEKLSALDAETVENMQVNLASFGWDRRREPLRIPGVRINFVSRLLYAFYDWGDVRAADVYLFTRVLLQRFDKLLRRLAQAVAEGEDSIVFPALDPDKTEVSVAEHAQALVVELEDALQKHGRYARWLRRHHDQDLAYK